MSYITIRYERAKLYQEVAAGKKPPTPASPKHSDPAEIVRQRYASDEPVEPDREHRDLRNLPTTEQERRRREREKERARKSNG